MITFLKWSYMVLLLTKALFWNWSKIVKCQIRPLFYIKYCEFNIKNIFPNMYHIIWVIFKVHKILSIKSFKIKIFRYEHSNGPLRTLKLTSPSNSILLVTDFKHKLIWGAHRLYWRWNAKCYFGHLGQVKVYPNSSTTSCHLLTWDLFSLLNYCAFSWKGKIYGHIIFPT